VDGRKEAWEKIINVLYSTCLTPGVVLDMNDIEALLPLAHKYDISCLLEAFVNRVIDHLKELRASSSCSSSSVLDLRYVLTWLHLADDLQLPKIFDECLPFFRCKKIVTVEKTSQQLKEFIYAPQAEAAFQVQVTIQTQTDRPSPLCSSRLA
jgi:hypothetical protein